MQKITGKRFIVRRETFMIVMWHGKPLNNKKEERLYSQQCRDSTISPKKNQRNARMQQAQKHLTKEG